MWGHPPASQSCPALPRECRELGYSAHLLMGLGSQQRLVSLGSILDFGGSSGCLFSAMISEQWFLKRGSHLELNMIRVKFEHTKMLIFDLYKCDATQSTPIHWYLSGCVICSRFELCRDQVDGRIILRTFPCVVIRVHEIQHCCYSW